MRPYVPSLAFALALLCGCSHTVISYNVGVFSKYGEDSTPQVAAMLKAENGDIAGLCELDSCNRRHDVFQLERLAEACGGPDLLFASAFPFAGGAYGNGILSVKKILRRDILPLPQGAGAEPRCAAVAETADMVFAVTHLDYRDKESQLLQAETINGWFTEKYSGCPKPVILCGDFNATPDSETVETLKEYWEILSPVDLPTYSTAEPLKCIDYIFALKSARHVKVIEARVIDAGNASDHFPVKVKFKSK